MKGLKIIILLVLSLLLLGLVSASSVTLYPTNKTSNHIFFDEVASYTIKISNTDDFNKVFSWSLNPVEWVVESPTSVAVGPFETKEVSFLIQPRPSNFRGPGSYILPVDFKSAQDPTTYEHQVTIYVKSINEREYSYKPSIALGASINSKIDPRDKVSVQVSLRNRNSLDIDKFTVRIKGDHFSSEKDYSLNGLEERSFEYQYDVPPLLKPGTYKLTADVIVNNTSISEVEKLYDIIPYSIIDRNSDTKTVWLKTTSVTTLTNKGNIKKVVPADVKLPFFKKVFSRVRIEANSYENIAKNSWSVTMTPNEQAKITIIENYRVLPILGILIILVLFLYFSLRSPIVLSKQTIVTGKDQEGISEMKIRVFIRNRTAKPYYNVRVLDKVPSIAHVAESDSLGAMQPNKIIRTEKRGTILKWDFETLEAYEERIVTYTIKARLKIIGNLGLPSVKIKFENAKGSQRTTESGRAQIGSKN